MALAWNQFLALCRRSGYVAAGSQRVRVYSVAKTLADLLKARNRVGVDVADEARRKAWRDRRFKMVDLERVARACRVGGVMRISLRSGQRTRNRCARRFGNTFARRSIDVPAHLPIAFTPAFAALPGKQAQWDAFNRRMVRSSTDVDLTSAIHVIADAAMPLFLDLAHGSATEGTWAPGGPWA